MADLNSFEKAGHTIGRQADWQAGWPTVSHGKRTGNEDEERELCSK